MFYDRLLRVCCQVRHEEEHDHLPPVCLLSHPSHSAEDFGILGTWGIADLDVDHLWIVLLIKQALTTIDYELLVLKLSITCTNLLTVSY